MTTLGDLMVTRGGSLNPAAHPNEEFDLYSIPAHDRGGPEVAKGSEIGSSKQIVQPGDVMISKIIPHIRRARVVGNADGRRQIASSEWIVFRGGDFEPAYLRHFLISDDFHGQFMNTVAGVGGSLVRARPQQVKSITIPLPPLDEQRRIAAILDQADALRAKRRQALALLDGLAQSIFLDMFGDPNPRTTRWPVVKLGSMLESAQYGTSTKADIIGEFPVLRMGNVTSDGRVDLRDLKYMDLSPVGQRKYLIKRGDILFNRTNSADLVGKTAIVRETRPLAFAGYLVRLRVLPEHDPEYLAAFLNSRYSKRLLRMMCKSIIGMANINAREVQSILVGVPPRRLQQQFAKRVAFTEAARATYMRGSEQLDELFTSLQQRAFAGEL